MLKNAKTRRTTIDNWKIVFIFALANGPLAQLNRVSDYGSEGYRFESCMGHTKSSNKEESYSFGVTAFLISLFIIRNMTDICCIGHITLDKIITPTHTAYLNGGTSYYISHALATLPPIGYKLITSLAETEMEAVTEMRKKGIDVEVIPSRKTVYFENKYGENMNNRTQRVLAKADPFTIDKLYGVSARFIHLGSLLADDFSLDVIKYLHGRGTLSVDAQGFLRYVDGENVYPCDWDWKVEALKYVDILKVNEFEIESLTGQADPHQAAEQLVRWGVKEVMMTFGNYGSIIFANGEYHEIPAYTPTTLVDATGCGDTYAAGYLYMRSRGAGYDEAGRFAAAMSTLKLEKTGPFDRSIDDIYAIMRSND